MNRHLFALDWIQWLPLPLYLAAPNLLTLLYSRRPTPRRTTRPAGISKTRTCDQPRRSKRLQQQHSKPNSARQRRSEKVAADDRYESGHGR